MNTSPKRRKLEEGGASEGAALPAREDTASGVCEDESEKQTCDSDDNEEETSSSSISGLSIDDDDIRAAESGPGPMSFVLRHMQQGTDPRTVLTTLVGPGGASLLPGAPDLQLWRAIIELLSEPPPRPKLRSVNTLDDVVSLIGSCSKIIVLTGAGVSVSCGIPDFRSRDGIYARLALDYPDLPNPQAMFDIDYFKKNPFPFFKFAKEIYPGHFQPSASHRFIRQLEEKGKLKRNYTQNIDTLEQVAGISHVIQCHGSFATATCMSCKTSVAADDIREDIFAQKLPRCQKCPKDADFAIYKPDIVFFGESLPQHFHDQIDADKVDCDLLIVIGSSLKVRPVALIPSVLPDSVPQILINREPLRHLNFDVELLGNCDEITRHLGSLLGWSHGAELLTQCSLDELLTPPSSPVTKTAAAEDAANAERTQRSDTCSKTEAVDRAESCAEREVKVTEDQAESHESTAICSGGAGPSSEPRPPVAVPGSWAGGQAGCSASNAAQGPHAASAEQQGTCCVSKTEQTAGAASDEEQAPSETSTSESLRSSLREPPTFGPSLSELLPAGRYLFLEPSRYVFPGAELRSKTYSPVFADDEATPTQDGEDQESRGAEVGKVEDGCLPDTNRQESAETLGAECRSREEVE